MKAIATIVMGLLLAGPSLWASDRAYPVKLVPFTSVHVNDVFWAPRIETNRSVTIPFAFQKDDETGRVDLFVRAQKRCVASRSRTGNRRGIRSTTPT